MTEAVRCGRCGVRYDARREKCPRCGGRMPRPIAAPGAPGAARWSGLADRRALGIGAAICLALLAIPSGIWVAWGTGSASAAPPASPSPLARVFKKEPVGRRFVGTPVVPGDIAFVDSPAAGRREYEAGNYEAALELFRAQIAANPGDAEARSNAGQMLVRLGRTTDALALLREAADMDPSRWAYRFNLARAEGLMGNWDKAAEDYGQAVRLFPGDYATQFNLGQALHRAGREEEAVAQYRLAIAQKPDDSSFYLALGTSEEKLGHRAEAAAAYRQFIAKDPTARYADAVKAKVERLEAAATPAAEQKTEAK